VTSGMMASSGGAVDEQEQDDDEDGVSHSWRGAVHLGLDVCRGR